MKAKRVAVYGLLIALALILSYVESLLPAFVPIPGIKVGLTNVVVLFALYVMDERSAVYINMLRIIIAGALFGTGVSILYSLAGGILSCAVMIFARRVLKLKIITVSILGGVFHNIGQILMAMLLLKTSAILWYLMVLWFTGIVAGCVVGLIAGLVVMRINSEGRNSLHGI